MKEEGVERMKMEEDEDDDDVMTQLTKMGEADTEMEDEDDQEQWETGEERLLEQPLSQSEVLTGTCRRGEWGL